MEPRIQYAQTADGVSIAFSVTGEGFPLVHVGFAIYGHLEMEWRIPEYRDWYQGLAKKRKLIRYDSRGTGLSQRDISDYSLSTRADDLSALVDYLGLKHFALVGLDPSVAVTYASSNAERVSHLVLWTPVTRLSDYESRATVVKGVAYQDWNLWAETEPEWVGISAPESRKLLTEMLHEFPSRDAYRSFEEEEWDLTTVLPTLRCETLVLHRRGNAFVRPETVQRVAATVPGSRLIMLEGREWLPGAGNVEAVLSAIDEFLGEGEETAAGATPPPAGGVHTILFTDVEGSTELTQRLGDAKAQELLRTHNSIVRDALKAHGGSEVKTMGDGFMASFSSATRALECAIAMQRAFAEWNEAAAARPSTGSGRAEVIRVRIGLNAGEPVAEEHDLFGTAVQLAARICSHAEPGQILVSDVVRQLVAGKGLLFSDRGETVLRGFEDPVRLYEVRWAA